MAEAGGSPGKTQRPVDILKEKHGGMSDTLKAHVKEQQQVRKKLRDALKAGSKTVPELAAAGGIEANKVLWHLMAMRRYGEVVEAGEENDYMKYQLKEA